ncbi:hypothetical protein P8C59_000992 [Phyllachora maydis]|uniref:CFEM domain-containing protein n=1 Tax=Phyllachora maydis TaxID=1825666 RepID=A0AAD9HXB0_9PEZI|nr:hypothetical protein P8C59_000992 [Phyllachora maydis]
MPTSRSALALLLMAAAASRLVGGQNIDSLPGCGKTCINNELGNPGLGCGASGKDLACLCANPNFGFGVRDCSMSACGPAVAAEVISAASALCATATQPAGPAATPPPAPTPSSTSAEMTTLILAPSLTSTVSPSAPTSSGQAAASSSTSSAAPYGAPKSTPATTSTSHAGTAGNNDASSTAAANLSTPVKAGIGVGVGAAGAALIGVAIFAMARRRHTRNSGLPMDNGPPPSHYRGVETLKAQISDPLQGSGRSFAHDPHYNQYETGLSDLEMRSRRYEDMVPRTSPKHLL